MYKLSLNIEEYFFNYKTEYAYYNIHAKKGTEDIAIARIPYLPYNSEFLTWLKVTLKMEEKREPHLTADQIDELIELFQDFLEEDADAPIYPTIEKFSKIMMSN